MYFCIYIFHEDIQIFYFISSLNGVLGLLCIAQVLVLPTLELMMTPNKSLAVLCKCVVLLLVALYCSIINLTKS